MRKFLSYHRLRFLHIARTVFIELQTLWDEGEHSSVLKSLETAYKYVTPMISKLGWNTNPKRLHTALGARVTLSARITMSLNTHKSLSQI